jgi:hypothetical protein
MRRILAVTLLVIVQSTLAAAQSATPGASPTTRLVPFSGAALDASGIR